MTPSLQSSSSEEQKKTSDNVEVLSERIDSLINLVEKFVNAQELLNSEIAKEISAIKSDAAKEITDIKCRLVALEQTTAIVKVIGYILTFSIVGLGFALLTHTLHFP